MQKNNRVGLWVAGAVVLVAVIVGVVGLLWPRPGETPPAATDNTSQPSAPAGNGTCPAALPASTTSTIPADLRWAASKGVTWPVSDTVGPTSTTGNFPTCFQQSPIGAALFGTSFLTASLNGEAYDLFNFYLVPSAEKDGFLKAAQSASPGTKTIAEQLKDISASYSGYRIDSFDGSSAAVTVVLAVPNTATGYRGIRISSVWVDGDWRVKKVLDSNGSSAVFDVLDGQFTKWSS